MASKRVNTACHFCDHAAQRAGRTAVALQVACSTPDCRKVFCSRPACRRKLPKSLSVQTREEFEAFKYRVDRGETIFVCQHCEDQSSCPGPQCQKRWKNRLARISKKGSSGKSSSVGGDSPTLTRQLSGDSAMSLDSLTSGVSMMQQQQQVLRYSHPLPLPLGLKNSGNGKSKSASLTREDLGESVMDRGDVMHGNFDMSQHLTALPSEDDFIAESVFPVRNSSGTNQQVWDSYLHGANQFPLQAQQQVENHGISVKSVDSGIHSMSALPIPQTSTSNPIFPGHPLYQAYGMDFNHLQQAKLLPPHMLRHSNLGQILEGATHDNSVSHQTWNGARLSEESVFLPNINEQALHDDFQFNHFMDPGASFSPGFCPPHPGMSQQQQHSAGKMNNVDTKPSLAELEHGEKPNQERINNGYGTALASFNLPREPFSQRSQQFAEDCHQVSSQHSGAASSSSSRITRHEQQSQQHQHQNVSENSGRTEEDLESVHSLHDIVLPNVDHEPFAEVMLSDLIRNKPAYFAGAEI
eukprot:TRINITY_DN22362_c0_g1_i1.p1 TRINITY_DN22362_c0_g1~~TRINITY_DN22362_c0_g1_i1.p1  ORF type:complete len:525 (+),score=122.33 TRINITY_DN22362_c0_g1_i1:268-1842(+)